VVFGACVVTILSLVPSLSQLVLFRQIEAASAGSGGAILLTVGAVGSRKNWLHRAQFH
jgi:hypothetical protein